MSVENIDESMKVKYILDEELKISFKALSQALQIAGIYVPTGRRLFQRVSQWMYSVTVQLLIWSSLTRIYFVYKSRQGSSGTLMTTLSYCICYIGSVYLSSTLLFASTKHMDPFLKELSDYKKLFGLAFSLKKLKVSVVIFLSTLGIYALVVLTVNVLCATIFTESLVNEFSVPFIKMTGISRVFGMIYVCVTNTFNYVPFPIVMAFFSWCYYILRKEYDAINKAVKRMVKDKNADIKCEAIRQQHIILTRVLDRSNYMITHFLFSCNVVWTPVICFLLYGLVRGGLTVEEFMTALAAVTTGISTLFTATLMSANLNAKAHGCLDDLLRLDMSQLSPKTLQIVSLFASRLGGPPIGFTVYGLFTVDGSTVLTIIGTLLTYAVVILQLTPGDIAPAVTNATSTNFLNASMY